MKKIWMLFVIGLSVFALSACAETNEDENQTPDVNDQEQVPEEELIFLTLEELAEFDGLEGRDAYIAVDGKIYDVTNSSRWPNGRHNGYQAGQDLTDPILNQSPHGLRTLDNIPMIGELVE